MGPNKTFKSKLWSIPICTELSGEIVQDLDEQNDKIESNKTTYKSKTVTKRNSRMPTFDDSEDDRNEHSDEEDDEDDEDDDRVEDGVIDYDEIEENEFELNNFVDRFKMEKNIDQHKQGNAKDNQIVSNILQNININSADGVYQSSGSGFDNYNLNRQKSDSSQMNNLIGYHMSNLVDNLSQTRDLNNNNFNPTINDFHNISNQNGTENYATNLNKFTNTSLMQTFNHVNSDSYTRSYSSNVPFVQFNSNYENDNHLNRNYFQLNQPIANDFSNIDKSANLISSLVENSNLIEANFYSNLENFNYPNFNDYTSNQSTRFTANSGSSTGNYNCINNNNQTNDYPYNSNNNLNPSNDYYNLSNYLNMPVDNQAHNSLSSNANQNHGYFHNQAF